MNKPEKVNCNWCPYCITHWNGEDECTAGGELHKRKDGTLKTREFFCEFYHKKQLFEE